MKRADDVRQARPNIPLRKHPVMRSFRVASKPIEEMLNTIVQWVDLQHPGGMIYGQQRLGKTEAIRHIMPLLKDSLESNVPVYLMSCSGEKIPHQNTFYEDLLRATDHSLARSGTAQQKRVRLVERLACDAANADESRVILFIDDAQWLHEQSYRWLMDLHNQLNLRDVHLITILVGQPELLDQRNAYRASRQLQVVARFMARAHVFRGLESAADLEVVLRQLDEREEYPEGSGWTYARYFVPQAYAAGWRLAHQATLVWQVLQEAYPWDLSRTRKHMLPMAAFSKLCAFLLYELHDHDSPELQLPEQLIREGISLTHLPPMEAEPA